MMVHIQDLPIELLQHILSFIANPENYYHPDGLEPDPNAKSDHEDDDDQYEDILNLSNICLVSRRFRDVAQPFLFCHCYDEDLGEGTNTTISFTKTIYHRPDLEKYVQDITISPIPYSSSGPQKALSGNEVKLFKSVIKDLKLADQEKTWMTAMEHGDLSVFVALLTNKTHNLRGLHLPMGHVSIRPLAQLFSRNPSYLANLEYLFIEGSEEFSGYNISSFQDFLPLPNLNSFTFEYGDLHDASFPSTWAPGTLAAEHLAFTHCHLDSGAITRLMQACKKVKTFTYNNYSLNPNSQRFIPSSAPPELNAAQASQAALLHKDTLEHFHLEFAINRLDIENIDEYNSSRIKIGSLRDFSVLKYIVVPHSFLPPHPQFPASVEKLWITDCNASFREMAQNIASDCKKGLYPNLTDCKVLAVDLTQPIKLPGQIIPEGKTPAECFAALQDIFKGTKVEFHIAPYKLSPGFGDYDDDLDDDLDYEHDDFDDDDGFPHFSAAGFPGLAGSGMPESMQSQLVDLLMQRALQDSEFAHLRSRAARAASEDSWETDGEDS